MVKLVGFRLPVRGVSFMGEVGAEKAWEPSKPCAVAGRCRITGFTLRDRFLTFLVGSSGGGRRGGGIEGTSERIKVCWW